MRVYRLSDEAISELRFAVDEHTDSHGTVRIAIDGGLKVKIREGAWSPPLDIITEGSPEPDPLTDLLTETVAGSGFGYCIGQYCEGPDVEPEDMVTCWRCRLLHDLRKALALP